MELKEKPSLLFYFLVTSVLFFSLLFFGKILLLSSFFFFRLLLQHDPVEKTRLLISALNHVSRDLLLPSHLYDSVSSIYHDSISDLSSPPLADNRFTPNGGDLMSEFEDSLLRQRPNCESGSRLAELEETRHKTRIQNRLYELEGLPSTRGEGLQRVREKKT